MLHRFAHDRSNHRESSEQVPVGAGGGSWLGVLPYQSSLAMPCDGKEGRKMRIRTGTLVDPQTEKLAKGYKV